MIMQINIRSSAEYQLWSREVQTLSDMLSVIGGFLSIIMAFGQGITGFFSEFYYMMSLIKNTFMIKIYYRENAKFGTQRKRTKKILRQYK
jgi:hypothetical protein